MHPTHFGSSRKLPSSGIEVFDSDDRRTLEPPKSINYTYWFYYYFFDEINVGLLGFVLILFWETGLYMWACPVQIHSHPPTTSPCGIIIILGFQHHWLTWLSGNRRPIGFISAVFMEGTLIPHWDGWKDGWPPEGTKANLYSNQQKKHKSDIKMRILEQQMYIHKIHWESNKHLTLHMDINVPNTKNDYRTPTMIERNQAGAPHYPHRVPRPQ